jgi:hypothetical protein
MIERDLKADLSRADALSALPEIRNRLLPSSLVWHALLLPLAMTDGVPKVVLTGHIVCHDCELCGIVGDLRDGGPLVTAPWRRVYADCCDADEFAGADFATAYTLQGTRLRVESKVAELLRLAYVEVAPGNVVRTGHTLTADQYERLRAWAVAHPAAAGLAALIYLLKRAP